ncbi:retrotransposon protein, putative, ty1-copia subclass [Tanacetum coccineum]
MFGLFKNLNEDHVYIQKASWSNFTFLSYVDDIIIYGYSHSKFTVYKRLSWKVSFYERFREAAFILRNQKSIVIERSDLLDLVKMLDMDKFLKDIRWIIPIMVPFPCMKDLIFEQITRDDTKSQTGYAFVLNGGAVDWKSSKQSTIAMFATESEYITASEAAMEAV